MHPNSRNKKVLKKKGFFRIGGIQLIRLSNSPELQSIGLISLITVLAWSRAAVALCHSVIQEPRFFPFVGFLCQSLEAVVLRL